MRRIRGKTQAAKRSVVYDRVVGSINASAECRHGKFERSMILPDSGCNRDTSHFEKIENKQARASGPILKIVIGRRS